MKKIEAINVMWLQPHWFQCYPKFKNDRRYRRPKKHIAPGRKIARL